MKERENEKELRKHWNESNEDDGYYNDFEPNCSDDDDADDWCE